MTALRDLLGRMGAEVVLDDDGLTLTGGESILGIDADLHDVGELAPAVAALCSLASTPSRLRGIAHIRGHETDRLAALSTELRALGAAVTEHEDGLSFEPAPLHGGTFHTYGDHRMAHAAVVVGSAVAGRAGRGRRHHVEDVSRVRGGLGGADQLMSGRYGEHDPESYERPRRRTRPRTKDRPSFDDAVPAVVVTVDRGRYTCRLGETEPIVSAMKSRALGPKAVITGDRVRLVGDTSGVDGSLARIVSVDERKTVLRRTADDDDPVERVIVANADQLVIVTALADPEPRQGLIDRALVAAYDAGMDPLLCLTKADLADPERLLSSYRPLGVPYVVTQRGADLTDIVDRLAGRTSVLLGHSGVGKSTLVNALVPDAFREVGVVNAVTGRGRHTSVTALMLALPGGGWIVDTPGIRSFGLAHVDPDQLIEAFPDLHELTHRLPAGLHPRGERT